MDSTYETLAKIGFSLFRLASARQFLSTEKTIATNIVVIYIEHDIRRKFIVTLYILLRWYKTFERQLD